jgi:hypothetical protein
MSSIWTASVDELLEKLAYEGLTKREITQRMTELLDIQFTQNMIGGRAWRLNIPLRPKYGHKPSKPKVVRPIQAKEPKVIIQFKPETKLPGNPGGCQYLHGEAAKRNFCGQPTVRTKAASSGSWCLQHEALVYTPGPKPKLGSSFIRKVTL